MVPSWSPKKQSAAKTIAKMCVQKLHHYLELACITWDMIINIREIVNIFSKLNYLRYQSTKGILLKTTLIDKCACLISLAIPVNGRSQIACTTDPFSYFNGHV